MAKIVYPRHFYVLKVNVLLFFIYQLSGSQCFAVLSINETLLNTTTCDATSVRLDCGTSAVIAIDTVELAYRAGTCTGDYDVTDCIQEATAGDRQTTLRECSGKSSCDFDLSVTMDFCTSGINPVSYVHVKYYCIDNSRIKDIDSTGTTMTSSAGEPLYLRNPGYPSKTTAISDWSCSLEVQACSSEVYLYVFDQDLYNTPTDCSQNVTFTDENGVVLKQLECESFYDSSALEFTLSNNYIIISYVTSTAFESYFFIGLSATDPSATFSVTCQEAAETWCIDCGSLPALADGTLTLTGDSSYGSTANAQCNSGYDTSASPITCMEQGVWSSAQCIIKDCGTLPALTDGTLTLPGDSTFGSTANVQCNSGYDASAATITCTSQGIWDSAQCTIKDCGNVPNINNGTIQLVNTGVTTYGAVANVTCDVGYTASTNTISCLASGNWQTATCDDDDKVDDDDDGDSSNDDKKRTFAWWKILLIVIGIYFAAQLITVLICKHKRLCKGAKVDTESTNRPPDDTDVERNRPTELQNGPSEVHNGHTELQNGPTELYNRHAIGNKQASLPPVPVGSNIVDSIVYPKPLPPIYSKADNNTNV